MKLLEIKGLTAGYGAGPVLKGIDIDVEEGEIVTLLGSNGAGKSTTLRTLSGLVPQVTGEILYRGQSILGMKPEAIVRLGISHVPEGRRIFPGLTVRENIILGASNRKGVPRRALMARPKVLLLDEPSMGLSPIMVDKIFEVIESIHKQGTTVLLVEQNAHMALSVADRGYVLETGKLLVSGKPEALWNDPQVRAAYLGGAAAKSA